MERCEVLIVGGGPAGSTCARKLQQAGVDVLIVDRKTFPRDKTCAGWVTPPVLESLEIDTADYRQDRVLQPITGFRTGMIGAEDVETHYDSVVSYGIRRFEFDDYLFRRAQTRNQQDFDVKSIERDGRRWIINGEIQADVLIGAGGHFCPVARYLGNRHLPGSSVVTAQEIEFAVTPADLEHCSIDPEMPELFFCEDLQGYGWCFRKENYLNIGLGRTTADRLTAHVEAFRTFLADHHKVTCELPQRFHGHAYQLYEHTAPRLIDDGVLLIGDSAGLAYAQSGEGIRPAVESGLLAAQVLLAAQSIETASLDEYAGRIVERFGHPRAESGPARWLPAGWLAALAAGLMKTHWFSKSVVLDRWFLHRQEPPLAEFLASHPTEQ